MIAGVQMPVDTSFWSPVAAGTYRLKAASPVVFSYRSLHHLRFEMETRAAIVAAAEMLSRSGMRFADFPFARCNERLWTLTNLGGFRIRDGVPPAAGIRDIFANGPMYATECATATVIAVYKGVLDSIRESDFNRVFAGVLLYNWHLDNDLRLTQRTGEAFPGDLQYFNNPDVNPETPQWRGENVVKIWENLYYGHPVGIVSGEAVIDGLNRVRRPFSFVSAYLTDMVLQPDYAYLSQFAPGHARKIIADIGSRRFVT